MFWLNCILSLHPILVLTNSWKGNCFLYFDFFASSKNGINIDLDYESIKQFNELRTRDINIQTLVTSFDDDEKDLYF